MIMKHFFCFFLSLLMLLPIQAQSPEGYPASYAGRPRFKALLHYEPHAEEAHVQFDKQAIEFFRKALKCHSIPRYSLSAWAA